MDIPVRRRFSKHGSANAVGLQAILDGNLGQECPSYILDRLLCIASSVTLARMFDSAITTPRIPTGESPLHSLPTDDQCCNESNGSAIPELDAALPKQIRIRAWESAPDLAGRPRREDLPPTPDRIHRRWDRFVR